MFVKKSVQIDTGLSSFFLFQTKPILLRYKKFGLHIAWLYKELIVWWKKIIGEIDDEEWRMHQKKCEKYF